MEKNINKEYRNSLVEKYMFLIENYVREFDINVQDDIRSLGYCELVKLIDSYFENDLEEDITSYISSRLNRYFRRLNKINYCVKYDERVIEDDCYQKDIDYNVDLDNMLNSLDDRAKYIVMLYSYSYTFKEIAEIVNLSLSRVEAIYKASIKSLKNNYIVHDAKILNLDDVSIYEIHKSDLSNREKGILVLLKMGLGKRTIASSYKIMPKDINLIEKNALIRLRK